MEIQTLRSKYEKVKAGFASTFGRDVLPADFDAFMTLITSQVKLNLITKRSMCSLADDIINASEVIPPMAFRNRELGASVHGTMYGVGFCIEYITYAYGKSQEQADDQVVDKLRANDHIFSYKEYSMLLGLRTVVTSIYSNIENTLLTTPTGFAQMEDMCKQIEADYQKMLSVGDDLAKAAVALESNSKDNEAVILGTMELVEKYGEAALVCYLRPAAMQYMASNKLNNLFNSMNTPIQKDNVNESKSDGTFSFKEF